MIRRAVVAVASSVYVTSLETGNLTAIDTHTNRAGKAVEP
jgi:hypothetical protein